MNNAHIIIRRYKVEDAEQLFALIEREGEAWKAYWQGSGKEKYQKALATSISYVLLEDKEICGYARCINDHGYGIYVFDLLVDKKYRGKTYGRLLMEQVGNDYPNDIIYVTSDVDSYYEKIGYEKEGTIFIVKK